MRRYDAGMPIADLGDVSLHYRDHGEGPPVLGIMGFALDQRFWAAQIAAVTATHRFITFDNRGVGRSTGEAPTSLEEMAADAVHLLDHLGIEQTVVFGASMGGTIAQRLVIDYPERVSALILAITWARPLEFMRRQHDVARALLRSDLGLDVFTDANLLFLFSPEFFEAGSDMIDRLVRSLDAPGGPPPPTAELLLGQIDALGKHDVLPDLGAVSCPTLVLGSRRDMLVPGFASEEIAAAIPGAELQMFDSSHCVMVEQMDAFNERIQTFLGAFLGNNLT